MNKTQIYVDILNKAYKIAEANLSEEAAKKDAEQKEQLVAELGKLAYIKVPFVGDFNAGKSSLINAMIGRDLLPTNILPQTAVPYELRFSEEEKLEVFEGEELKATEALERIKELKLDPKCHVVVYINHPFIKQLNDRNIVLVDMPGIDSGIEAHNNAILQYIQEGNCFFLVTAAEGGTLKESTVSFIDEVRKYDTPLFVAISQCDKKPVDALDGIKCSVSDIAEGMTGGSVPVVLCSAAKGDFSAVQDVLNTIDSELVISKRYSGIVQGLVNGYIAELQVRLNFLASSKSDFSEEIARLEQEKEDALKKLNEKMAEAQPLKKSADDILDDVKNALIDKADSIANLLYEKAGNDALNRENLSIVRPVLVNSLEKEVKEYQGFLGGVLEDFSKNVGQILSDNGQIDRIVKSTEFETMVRTIEALLLNWLRKLLSSSKWLVLIAPLLEALIKFIPDILISIFGKSKEKVLCEIKAVFINKVVAKIVESLREPVESILSEQRGQIDKAVADLVEQETRKYDENIQHVMREKQEDEQQSAAKIEQLQKAIVELQAVVAQVK